MSSFFWCTRRKQFKATNFFFSIDTLYSSNKNKFELIKSFSFLSLRTCSLLTKLNSQIKWLYKLTRYFVNYNSFFRFTRNWLVSGAFIKYFICSLRWRDKQKWIAWAVSGLTTIAPKVYCFGEYWIPKLQSSITGLAYFMTRRFYYFSIFGKVHIDL